MLRVIFISIGIGLFSNLLFAQSQSSQPETAKNIILLIGDGMGVDHIYAGITANHGYLNLERINRIGFSKTYSATDFITDSGAGGTAIATGHKSYNHAIGMSADSVAQPTLLEIAEQMGKGTGLVATSEITHATPASFIAHVHNRNNQEAIAGFFLETDIDVFIGGGYKYFAYREDGRNLIDELLAKNYQVCTSLDEMQSINHGKLAGLIYEDKPPRASKGRGDMLLVSTKKAIELLEQSENGFFLMIEGSQIDWGAHKNNTDYVVEELLDFDKAVGYALDYADTHPNTLVIVTADHETGGMAVTKGDINSGFVAAKFTSLGHTGSMVPVFAKGPGENLFGGIYENTDVFKKILEAFGF